MTRLEKLEQLVYYGIKESAKETERMLKASSRETERMLKEIGRETDRRMQETDRRMQETDQMMKESARQLDELKLQMRGLTKSLGLFAESMVYPATIPLFRERGIVLTGVSSRLREQRNGGMMEVDVLGTGPEAIVVVEAKLRLDLAMVKDFLKRLPDFFKYFPRYAGPKLYGAVAGMSVEQSVARFACKQGLFVLTLAGDNMVIWNDDKFQPRVFSATSKQAGKKK